MIGQTVLPLYIELGWYRRDVMGVARGGRGVGHRAYFLLAAFGGVILGKGFDFGCLQVSLG